MGGIRMAYRNLRLRLKLAISHGTLGILALIVMFTGLISIKSLIGYVNLMYTGPVANTEHIGDLRYGITDLERAVNALMLEGQNTYATFEKDMTADEVTSGSEQIATGSQILAAGAAVEKGSRIATETATSLVEVVEGTKSVTGLVEQIANAANEQAEALTQLNMGIAQISSVVDTTSATAEESASAGEELSGQAEVLRNLIHQFRLNA